jgi:hypothetical protein
MGMSASFSFKVYTERWANVLALEWQNKMQWFYSLGATDGEAALLQASVLDAYEPTAAFLSALNEVDAGETRFHQRAQAISQLRPRPPA